MNIDTLKNFIVMAEEENITTASKKLHVAQPHLSRQLKGLEDSLGVSLFNRNKQRVALTKEGQYLLDSAKQIVALMEKTERQIKEISSGTTGSLYIGSAEAAYADIVPDLIRDFREAHPHIVYHLFSANSEEVYKGVTSNSYDVGVALEPYNSELFTGVRIYSGTYLAAFHRSSPLANHPNAPITLKELADYPLLLSTRKVSKENISTAFKNAGVEPQIVCEYSQLMSALSMISINMGVAVVPSPAASWIAQYPDIVYRKIIEPVVPLHISVVRKKSAGLEGNNPVLDLFWSYLINEKLHLLD